MKPTLRTLALVVALAAAGIWLALGAHRGWTKTSVATHALDPVTGIEGVTYERRFVPGLDLLAAAWLGASLLFGSSVLFSNKPTTQPAP